MVVRAAFPHASKRHVPVIEGERVCDGGRTILERPDDKDREDAERLTQTHLEQVSENQKFRVLGRFFESVRYLHIVRSAAALNDVAALIEQGLSPGEAIMPRAAARDVHQLSLSF